MCRCRGFYGFQPRCFCSCGVFFLRRFGGQRFQILFGTFGFQAGLAAAPEKPLLLLLQRFPFRRQRIQSFLTLRQTGDQIRDAFLLPGVFLVQAPDGCLVAPFLRIQQIGFMAELRGLILQLSDLHPELLCFFVCRPDPLAAILRGTVELLQIFLLRPQTLFGGFVLLGQNPGLIRQTIQRIHPKGDLQSPQFVPQDQILLCRFRLLPQRLQLQIQFPQFVPQAKHILLRPLQLPQGFLPLIPVFGDTGSFLKDLPPVCAFGCKNLVDPALAYQGIPVTTQSGIHEKGIYILQTHQLAVDIILTVPAAIIPAGDHHFIRIPGKTAVLIAQDQGDLGKTGRAPLRGTAEDHVLHFGTAEGLCPLFTQYPGDRVCDIRFSAAVWSHNGAVALLEGQAQLIRKGLEALNL